MSPDFAKAVVEKIAPVVEPHGFISQPQGEASVLFHCDGTDAVAQTLARHPAWRAPLVDSYGGELIPCLDLWVQLEEGARVWAFEIFDADVRAANEPSSLHRLDELQGARADKWAAQLAYVLAAYFDALDHVVRVER